MIRQLASVLVLAFAGTETAAALDSVTTLDGEFQLGMIETERFAFSNRAGESFWIERHALGTIRSGEDEYFDLILRDGTVQEGRVDTALTLRSGGISRPVDLHALREIKLDVFVEPSPSGTWRSCPLRIRVPFEGSAGSVQALHDVSRVTCEDGFYFPELRVATQGPRRRDDGTVQHTVSLAGRLFHPKGEDSFVRVLLAAELDGRILQYGFSDREYDEGEASRMRSVRISFVIPADRARDVDLLVQLQPMPGKAGAPRGTPAWWYLQELRPD